MSLGWAGARWQLNVPFGYSYLTHIAATCSTSAASAKQSRVCGKPAQENVMNSRGIICLFHVVVNQT
jgi:hypothetical protein